MKRFLILILIALLGLGMAFNWKSNQNDDIVIDRDTSKLKLEMKRWGDECKLGLNIPVPTQNTIQQITAKQLRYSSPAFDVIFDKKDPTTDRQCELGGVEFTVKLHSKPAGNSWAFPINTTNLEFWYQPPLTQQLKNEGHSQPDNVAGSYAVYKIDRKTVYTNPVEAEKYKVGKVFHIYRPKVWDSSAIPKEVWADLNVTGSTLSITIDQQFLDTATYPVYIDPTFGYDTAGSNSGPITDHIYASAYANSSGAGTASKMTASVVRSAGVTSHLAKCAIYDNSDPCNYVQTTDEISTIGTVKAWHDFNFSTKPSISDSTTYTLAAWGDVTGGSGNVIVYYDTSGSRKCVSKSETYNGWPSTLTRSSQNWQFSIYVTFDFPHVEATNTSTDAGTSHTVSLPSGISVGDLLIVFFATDGDNTITDWDGFTELFSTSNGTAASLHVAYKIAVGSDTLTVTTSENEASSHAAYRITGHNTSQMPEVSTGATGSSSTPDPDSLTPTGGAKDYLWIAVEGNDHSDLVTYYPTNFHSNNLNANGGASTSCGVGVATRDLSASVLDPGTFTLEGTEQWIACTVVVHPVGVAPIPKSVSDSGSGSDSVSIKVLTTVADSGAGADTPSLKALLSLADSGSGTDLLSILNKLTVSDAGSGSDVLSILAKLTILDSGLGTDAIALIKAILTISDSGIGTDQITVTSPYKFVTDAGSGQETIGIKALLSLSDVGSGVDSVTIKQFRSISDSGLATEILAIKNLLSVVDTGLGADAFSLLVKVAIQDSGLASELVSVSLGALYPILFQVEPRDRIFNVKPRQRMFRVEPRERIPDTGKRGN